MPKHFKIFKKLSSLLIILAILAAFLPNFYKSSAATLTTIYDRLSTVEQSQTTGVDHYIVFTPATQVSGGTNSVLVLQFPDADDGLWCRTAGTDLVVSGITEDSSTALPGTLSAKCTQGSGASSYDKIYICATGTNTWSAATKYGVSVKDGTIAKLGTPTAANNIKVTATTGTAATCTDPTAVDSGSFSLSILSDATVSVTATVDPLLSFSISQTALDFGTFSSTTVRYTTGGASSGGSTSEPANGQPSVLTLSTNAPNGAFISARSKGDGTGAEGNGSAGLYKSSSPTKLIAATAPNAVSSGTESYALYLKNAASNLSIASGFGATGATALTTSSQTIATASGPLSSNNTVDLVLKAAISSSTASGNYSDVIYLTATGKF